MHPQKCCYLAFEIMWISSYFDMDLSGKVCIFLAMKLDSWGCLICLIACSLKSLGTLAIDICLVWFVFLFFICLFAFKKLHINVFCTAQLELWPSYASLCVQSKWTELGMFYYRWSLSGLTCQYQRPQNNQLLNDSVTPVRARSGHTTLPSPGHSCALVLHIYMHLSPH